MLSTFVQGVFKKGLHLKDFESVIQAGSVPPEDVSTLTFIRSVLKFCQDDADSCLLIFKQLDKPGSAVDLAERLFPRDGPGFPLDQSGIKSSTLEAVRNGFFEEYPLAVMRAFLKHTPYFSLAGDIKELVIYLIEQAVTLGCELRSDETLMRMHERYSIEGRTDTDTLTKHFPEALKVVKTLNGLCRLAQDPDDVQLLYKEGYRTARAIAAEQKQAFVYAMTNAGLKQESAHATYNAAKRVDCWNEHLWLAMMEAQRAEFVPVEPQNMAPAKTKTDVEASRLINNLTDIFELEDWACETCCSITSLSAYYADLLALLNRTSAKPGSETSMLDVLSLRRPDLKHLQLTCANSQTLIPYVALTNEVLESYIRYQHEKSQGKDWTMVQPYNTPDEATETTSDEHDNTPIEQPANMDPVVNTELIPNQMFPFSTFPYSRARNDIGQIFSVFGVDASQVVETFTYSDSLSVRLPDEAFGNDIDLWIKASSGLEEVFARQAAAETLGMLQADFAAITGETFYPAWFADIVNGLVGENKGFVVEAGCRWSVASLWGYDSEAVMLESDSGDGLCWVKKQFLKRSGLEFKDLLALTKTRSFRYDLAIVNKSGSKGFSTSLEGLLLLPGASNPPLKPLTNEICFNLQAFLRLQAKLKWSIHDLDAAIFCLRSRELDIDAEAGKPKVPDSFSISPYVLKGIASIVELSKLVDMEPSLLLPLWHNIDTFGPESLMHRKFLTPSMRQVSPIFDIPSDGQYLMSEGKFLELRSGKAETAICSSLGWPVEDLADLMNAAKFSHVEGVADELNIETFSVLYRHVLLCRMLSIEPGDCSQFFRVLSSSFDSQTYSLDTPTSTLSLVKRWRAVIDAGKTLQSLDTTNDEPGPPSDETEVSNESASLLTALTQGTKALKHTFPYLFTNTVPLPAQAVECASHLFNPPTVKLIMSYIEGTQVESVLVSLDSDSEQNIAYQASRSFPDKLVLVPDLASGGAKALLTLPGAVTSQEIESIVAISEGIKESSAQCWALTNAIDSLIKLVLVPRDIIRSRFESAAPLDVDALKTIAQGSSNPAPSSTPLCADEQLLEAERMKQERRSAFVQLAAPSIVEGLLATLVTNTIKTVVPDLDISTLHVLLTDSVQVQKSYEEFELAMTALQRLCHSSIDPNEHLDAYFAPTKSDNLIFTCNKRLDSNGGAPHLTINNVSINLDSSQPVPLAADKIYHLVATVAPDGILWSTPTSAKSNFAEGVLLPTEAARLMAVVIEYIKQAAAVCQLHRLTPDEIRLITRTSAKNDRQSPIFFFIHKPTIEDTLQLSEYRKLKAAVQPKADSGGLPGLFSWFFKTKEPTLDVMAEKISDCTGWDRSRLLHVLESKYSSYPVPAVSEKLRLFDEFVSLSKMMALDEQIGRAMGKQAQPRVSTLFDLASSRYMCQPDKEADVAQLLREKLAPSQRAAADRGLMDDQRRVLVAYLLQQKYIKWLDIEDADGLFEHFLIDVQMGPQLKTSRIKQAISVVQLFVQRCLLGLEQQVHKSCVVREQWEWRQQYSLWEAHVKLFIYPENWVEPSLRDDKSQLFDKFEASLMKKHLSLETFEQALKTYVQGLNEISSLEILTYVVDVQESGTEVYHFFGRTRAAPHTFYYRTLTLVRSDTSGGLWRPWTKIDIDIPTVETEWQGKRLDTTGTHLVPVIIGGRLYLFIPHIVAKTSPPGTDRPADYEYKSFGELSSTNAGTVKPQKIWEITMGWTELIHDGWSPKRVATGSVKVNDYLPPPNEIRFEPRFESDTSSTKVTLLIGCNPPAPGGHWLPEKYRGLLNIGGFQFCEDQMVALSYADVYFMARQIEVFRGTFQQLTSSQATPQNVADAINEATRIPPAPAKKDSDSSKVEIPPPPIKKPLLWLPQEIQNLDRKMTGLKERKATTWTLSYSRGDVPAALVVSTKRADGTNISYFNLPQKPLFPLSNWIGNDSVNTSMKFVELDHSFSHKLMEAAANRADPLKRIYKALGDRAINFENRRDTKSMAVTFGADPSGQPDTPATPGSASYHELAQPTALYNWEIGLHSVLLAADRFFASQQFEEALQVARLVFDPSSEVCFYRHEDSNNPLYWTFAQSCWKFPPFQGIAISIQERQKKDIKLGDLVKDSNFNLAIMERRSHGALVHATARGRPEAYMKWIVMKYAEILIAAGDVHFRQGTLESLPLAIQRYVEAGHILGPEPNKIPKLGNKKPRTFADLNQEDADIELGLPFSSQLKKGTQQQLDADPKGEQRVCYLRTTYFSVPLNPKFKQLRTLLNERLYNVRNSLDIQGRPVTYALIEPLIDPGALMALDGQGLDMSEAIAIADQNSPLPRQRFEILLHRSLELCSELRSLGERLLAAIERKENEAFSTLRQRHAVAIQKMMLDIKNLQLKESQQTIDSLLINRDSQVSQLKFYLELIGESESLIPTPTGNWEDLAQNIDTPTKDDLRMSSYEKMEMDMTSAASLLNTVAAGIDALVGPLCAIPEIETMGAPLGVGASVTVGGQNIAMATSAGSTYLKMMAMMSGDEAGRASRKAQLTRQLQDRRLQANLHGREIKSIDKQIELQKIRVQSAQHEIKMQHADIEDAIQAEKWYRTKYTNKQLYSWMEKSLRGLYYQAYTLALNTARKAESSLSFEQGRKISLLRPGGYWDSSHDGLLAADHLHLDLKRLETAHFDGQDHDFEVSKTISLRQIDPLALLSLRLKGSASFSLNESLFDMDFPGHFMRRIRSVAVSIPAIVGPHTNINATLQLTGHRYRVSTSASKAADYMAQVKDSFRTDHIPISAVAISSGSGDTGVFNLSFSGPKYMPFEGAGVISSWRLDLPTEIRKFDYESISDVLIHIQYTAQEGGALLRAAANEAVRNTVKAVKAEGTQDGFWAMFDLKNDFTNEWYGFSTRLVAAKKNSSQDTSSKMELGNLKDRLPFWSRQQTKLEVRDIVWVSQNNKLVHGVSVQGVGKPDDGNIKTETLGKCTTATWKDLHVRTLDKWTVEASPTVLDEDDETVDNVYMLIHYVFL
ncbi:hypothetical protein ACHAPT_008833 [Fusarium lateritium]